MQKSKLLQIFKTLTKEELKQLKRFVRSPFFNTNKELIDLYELMAQAHPDFEERKVNKQLFFKKIFKQKKYDDGKMRYTMTQLLKVINDFLAYQYHHKNKANKAMDLLSVYRERGLKKQFESTLGQIRKAQASQILENDRYFYHAYYAEQEQHQYLLGQQDRKIEPNYQGLSDSLGNFYVVEQLRCYIGMLNYRQMVNVNYEYRLEDKILEFLAERWQQMPPIAGMYYNALLTLLDHNNEGAYRQLKNLLRQNGGQVPVGDLQTLHILVRRFCIRHINMGNTVYEQELFDLYVSEVESGMILVNGVFPRNGFGNVVSVALRLQKFDWIEIFLKQYAPLLDVQFRANTILYNLARLRFGQQRFSEVIDLLHQLEYNELFLTLNARALLIKTYYELGETLLLESQLNSFKEYLRRHEEIGYQRKMYQNFVRFVERLHRLPDWEVEKWAALKAEILKVGVMDKGWLLGKV